MKKLLIGISFVLSLLFVSSGFFAPTFAIPTKDTDTNHKDSTTATSGQAANRSSGSYGIDSSCNYFLGMVSWNCNVDVTDEESLKQSVWTIVGNIASDISVIAAYLVIAYTIYGGYLYVFSRGEASKVAEGKKTLTQAFIGLAIVMTASIIINSIRIALGADFTKNCAMEGECVSDAGKMILGYISWVIGLAGIMSVIFVIYGGIMYIISTGDPGKVKKAKDMIMYSLIGLAIVALSATITAFVSNAIRTANENAYINNTLISKEVHEIKNT